MGSEVGKKRAEDAGVGGPGLLSFSFFLKKREGERVEFFFFFFFLAADGKSAKRFSLSSLFFALSVPPPSSITNRSEHHADHSLFASPVEQPREGVDVADSDHLCLIGIVRILRGGRCWRAGRRDAGPTPAGRHGFVAVAGRGGAIERGGKGDRGKRAWRRREKQSHP